MEKHSENREKMQETKLKEYKMIEENWKRRFEDILRKNKVKEREAYQKAEKMRRDVEEYWNKKSDTAALRDDSLKRDKRNSTVKPYTSLANQRKDFKLEPKQETAYPTNKIEYKINFPDVRNRINKVDLSNDKSLNRSLAESTLNEEIRSHQEKSLKDARDEEADKIQKYLEKLAKIERTRKTAQEKMEKEVQ
jgi:hypothetical protein